MGVSFSHASPTRQISDPYDPGNVSRWRTTGPTNVPGMTHRGNIDLGNRPLVHHGDNGYSSLYSSSSGTDAGETLYPLVDPSGRMLTPEEGLQRYRMTGQNLGTFKNPDYADRYGQLIHYRQGDYQRQRNAGMGYFPSKETDYTFEGGPEDVDRPGAIPTARRGA